MRIYETFPVAFNEIKRDLGEMGVRVHTRTMQDKEIAGDQEYETMELFNYSYMVLQPEFKDLQPTQPWADAEWAERLSGINGHPLNPGEAWRLRDEVWDEFIHDGTFQYTYSDRFSLFGQVHEQIRALKNDSLSRQAYISMFRASDSQLTGTSRVPCSLGWHFIYRQNALHMTYFMRSCDFATHFQNDIYLAMKLWEFIASQCDMTMGNFTHWISSLHIYQKDVADVF